MIRKCLGLLTLCAAGVLLSAPAAASSIDLLAQSTLVSGRQSFVYEIKVAAPGTLAVTLTDLNWLGRLSDLSFSLTNGNGLLASSQDSRSRVLPAAASEMASLQTSSAQQFFDVTAPGTYYAYVSGTATSKYGLGLFGLNATLTTSSVVPLPAAGWLLFSGLGGLLGLSRRRARLQAA